LPFGKKSRLRYHNLANRVVAGMSSLKSGKEKQIPSVERRISDLEAKISMEGWGGFPEALEESRLRAARGEPSAKTPITPEMMDDPVHGRLYRLIHEGRERVRNAREDIRNCPGGSAR